MRVREQHDRDARVAHALGWSSVALGAGLVAVQLARRSSSARDTRGTVRVSKTFTINRDARVVYAAWLGGDALPRVLRYLRSLHADIVEDIPETRIAWRSSDARGERVSGAVHFTPAPGDRGTEVRVEIEYTPFAGRPGNAVARLLRAAPEQRIQEDLRRLKQLLETGEIARTAGSSNVGQPAQPAPDRESDLVEHGGRS